jgi:hypothetical protein
VYAHRWIKIYPGEYYFEIGAGGNNAWIIICLIIQKKTACAIGTLIAAIVGIRKTVAADAVISKFSSGG